MKTGWERRQPYIPVAADVLRAMVAPVSGGKPPESCELIASGLVNTNYKVVVDGSPVLVRIYGRDPDACAKETAIFRRFGHVLPIPEVLHADASGTLLPQPYAVHRWVEGVLADDVASAGDLAGIARACGELLAALSGQTYETGDAPLTPEFYRSWMHEWVLGTPAKEALGADLAAWVLAWAGERAPLLEELGGERSLVHSDFNGANILMRQGARGLEVAALLDWEFAFSGTSLFDVANMLRHYTLFGPAFGEPFVHAFTRGGGRLPLQWLDTARALDMMSLVGFLARPDCGATIRRDVLALVKGYLAG